MQIHTPYTNYNYLIFSLKFDFVETKAKIPLYATKEDVIYGSLQPSGGTEASGKAILNLRTL